MSDKPNTSTIYSSEDEKQNTSVFTLKNKCFKESKQNQIANVKPKQRTNIPQQPIYEHKVHINKENLSPESFSINQINKFNINCNVLQLNTGLNKCDSEIKNLHSDISKINISLIVFYKYSFYSSVRHKQLCC